MTESPIDARAVIGHVHLKVSDVDRSEEWYTRVLGFETQTRYGSDAVFMSAGGYHHHIALNQWHTKGAAPAPAQTPGLFHLAILYPDRPSLGVAVARVLHSGWPLDGASDHGVSEAVYLHDPDFNGIELYRDRPRPEWPRHPDGSLAMTTAPLDLDALLSESP